MYKFLSSFMIILTIYGHVSAQDLWKTYELEPVIVTATRLDQKYAATRSVSVLTREQIEHLPAQSITQLLNYVFGVSMNSRGAGGVQSDPSMRGSGFEQVLIMLDGVRMNDPQTGHHNINLPITIQDIERIEVLRGQGSALYGPDAFGGVINVITKSSSDSRVSVTMNGGSFKTFHSGATLSVPTPGAMHRLSFESSVSDGYEDFNRQYRIRAGHWKSSFTGEKHRLSLSSGIIEKDFGAQYFYTSFGREYEETRSAYAGLREVSAFSPAFTSTITIHYKRHKDFFNLFFDNPSIYTARHTTQRFTGEWTGRYITDNHGSFTVGAEGISETITSSALGDHDNSRFAVFGEYGTTLKDDILVNLGLRLDNHSVWGAELNPSVSLGYVASPDLLLKASLARSFRSPTFIELYSPRASGNRGDPGLEPERAINLDLGAEYALTAHIRGTTTYYRRSQDHTIDWTATSDADGGFFQAFTFIDIVSQGIEQDLSITSGTSFAVDVSYNYLHQNVDKDLIDSRYLFIYPQHHLSITPRYTAAQGFDLLAVVSWKERTKFNNSWVVNARASYTYGNMTFTVDGFNLLDEDYQEIRNVPMPGRAAYAGVKFSF